jgi:hypothetical protein
MKAFCWKRLFKSLNELLSVDDAFQAGVGSGSNHQGSKSTGGDTPIERPLGNDDEGILLEARKTPMSICLADWKAGEEEEPKSELEYTRNFLRKEGKQVRRLLDKTELLCGIRHEGFEHNKRFIPSSATTVDDGEKRSPCVADGYVTTKTRKNGSSIMSLLSPPTVTFREVEYTFLET